MLDDTPPGGELTIEVSDEQIARYHAQGFLAIERITTDEEVAWIGRIFDALFADRDKGLLVGYLDATRGYGAEGPARFGQVLFPEQRAPGLRDTVFARNARRIASRLLEEREADLEAWGHMIDKPPGTGDETPLHQDEAYWSNGLRYHAIGGWLALDDADEENGCLWYLPGTHLGPVHPHRHLRDDPTVHALELAEPIATSIDVATEVPIPLAAGGAVFHHPRTVHRAGPNTSPRRRRSFSIEHQTAPVASDDEAPRPWVDETEAAMADEVARHLAGR